MQVLVQREVCEGVRMHQQRAMWALMFTRIVYAKLNIVGYIVFSISSKSGAKSGIRARNIEHHCGTSHGLLYHPNFSPQLVRYSRERTKAKITFFWHFLYVYVKSGEIWTLHPSIWWNPGKVGLRLAKKIRVNLVSSGWYILVDFQGSFCGSNKFKTVIPKIEIWKQ